MPYVGQDWRSPGGLWTKTQAGWRGGEYDTDESNCSTFSLTGHASFRPQSKTDETKESEWQPVLRQIQGVSKERRTLVGLSDAFLKMDMARAAVQISGLYFCAEVFKQLLKQKFSKLSGTFKTYMFKTMEQMLEAALSLEIHVPLMNSLLQTSAETLDNTGLANSIGGKILLKKNQEEVNQMISKLTKFEYTQPDESQLLLLDLPKECLQNIVLHLSDHKDIIRLGATCTYLHELIKDPFLWRQMCFFQFTEKQLYPYIDDAELNEVDWLEIYKLCFRKKKVPRCVYGNQMVMCNNCRVVFWKMQGHPCPNSEKTVSCALMTPNDFINLFLL